MNWYQRRIERLTRHEKAQNRLVQELDLVQVLKIKRISEFISKLFLKRHQRALVSSFRQYQFDQL